MSWASHPTNEMPATSPNPAGRHRRRRTSIIGIGAVAVLLVLIVLAAMLSPTLFGWPPASTNAAAEGLAGTPGPTSPAGGTQPPSLTLSSPSPDPTPKVTPTLRSATSAPARPTTDAEPLENEVVRLTNAERTSHGCAALRSDNKLRAVARNHSAEMASILELSHSGFDGSDPGARMKGAGYNTTGGWAENVAAGYPTPEAVMTGWMNSEAHRNNILDCSLKAVGVGVARADNGQLYWTQDFGGR